MSPVSRCISPTACIINKNNKSFTRFFSCRDLPPPVCLRFSPGLFRHGGGAASCHTYSMAANPHLALTKNSSTSTLANGRCAVQIAVSKGSASGRPAHGAKHPRRARRVIPNRPKAPSADGAIPGQRPCAPPPPPPRGGRWGASFYPSPTVSRMFTNLPLYFSRAPCRMVVRFS